MVLQPARRLSSPWPATASGQVDDARIPLATKMRDCTWRPLTLSSTLTDATASTSRVEGAYYPLLGKEPAVSVETVARKFVELCRAGKNFDVMRTMYAPDIVSVEGDGKETRGQQPVI